METNFTCLPVPGTNMTIITAFAALFGGDPRQLVSKKSPQTVISDITSQFPMEFEPSLPPDSQILVHGRIGDGYYVAYPIL